nr:immunoglobulin light chain junction region [Macaca mulatta]MOW27358.1 immunoglobulin light chain junction region [Macaca mulatta]MOW27374.1 immunoglobulin light chain junction region [Macaca mulatta]MOW27444.1 immunoglobulin light chain junction region [Macaca mulatta]MOW27479.1 immunoglobulin light chain junction region [Macaca mulatta]
DHYCSSYAGSNTYIF